MITLLELIAILLVVSPASYLFGYHDGQSTGGLDSVIDPNLAKAIFIAGLVVAAVAITLRVA